MGRVRVVCHLHIESPPFEVDLERLTSAGQSVLDWCESEIEPGPGECSLPELTIVEVSLVSDEKIAEVHASFMDDPSVTDVITFHHGEILISLDTALRVAGELEQLPLRETCLYLVHGLLHLHGYRDGEESERRCMHELQDGILERVWPLP